MQCHEKRKRDLQPIFANMLVNFQRTHNVFEVLSVALSLSVTNTPEKKIAEVRQHTKNTAHLYSNIY
jgi:hypothetical protein